MRTKTGTLVIAGIIGGSVALAGCATARPASVPVPATLTEPTLTVLVKGGSYADDEATLHRASEELLRRCMAARGHRYVPLAYEPATMMSLTDDDAHPDVTWRRATGYRLDQGSAANPVPENDRYLRTLPMARQADWSVALKGDGTRMSSMKGPTGRTFHSPLDGCIAEGNRLLYGSPEDADRAVYYLQDGRFRLLAGVQRDTGYAAAMTRWATCMRQRGYRYTTPADARTALQARYRGRAASAVLREEKATAVADAECAHLAELGRESDRFLRERADELPTETRRELNRAASARTRGLAAAERVLTGG